jgi:hypothetical protein
MLPVLFQITLDRQMDLSFLGLPTGMLHNYLALIAKLRESFGALPTDLVNLVQLAMLWSDPEPNNPGVEVHHAIGQAKSLSGRYIYHLTQKLDQSGVASPVTDMLLRAVHLQATP